MQKIGKTLQKSEESEQGFVKKKLKLQLAETVFVCECDKQFLSFPAIYSHCKIKHGIKISSKLQSGLFKRQTQGGQQKIVFKFKEEENNSDLSQEIQGEVYGKNFTNKRRTFKIINKMSRLNTEDGGLNVYGAISKYLKFYTQNYSHQDASKVSDILLILTQCMNTHYMVFDQRSTHKNYCQDTSANTIPLFYNFLLVWYLPTKDYKLDGKKMDLTNMREALVHFSAWLRNQGLTEYQASIKENSETQEDSHQVEIAR